MLISESDWGREGDAVMDEKGEKGALVLQRDPVRGPEQETASLHQKSEHLRPVAHRRGVSGRHCLSEPRETGQEAVLRGLCGEGFDGGVALVDEMARLLQTCRGVDLLPHAGEGISQPWGRTRASVERGMEGSSNQFVD